MPVAKSYANLEQISEPYKRDKKTYIKVLTAKGIEKEVRWYSETEYYNMYPELKPKLNFDPEKAFGFYPLGYITIFKEDDIDDYLLKHKEFQYATHLGWFMKSKFTLPADLPSALTPVRLYWIDISENGEMYDEDTVKLIVNRVRRS